MKGKTSVQKESRVPLTAAEIIEIERRISAGESVNKACGPNWRRMQYLRHKKRGLPREDTPREILIKTVEAAAGADRETRKSLWEECIEAAYRGTYDYRFIPVLRMVAQAEYPEKFANKGKSKAREFFETAWRDLRSEKDGDDTDNGGASNL